MTADYILKVCEACKGTKEGTQQHQTILDIYNTQTWPGKRAYKIGRNDPWCAAFVSAVFLAAGAGDLIPLECSCFMMKHLGDERGMLRDPKRYIPKPGDIIFYKWAGKNVVGHVGIVKSVKGSSMQVYEGNFQDKVGIRQIKLSYKYIDSYLEVKYG